MIFFSLRSFILEVNDDFLWVTCKTGAWGSVVVKALRY